MYQRDEKNFLLVKNAWTIPQLPMCIVIELPDGMLKRWGVHGAGQPRDDELHEYKGCHPDSIPTADKITGPRLQVFGLVKAGSEAGSELGKLGKGHTSERKSEASRNNGRMGGRPVKKDFYVKSASDPDRPLPVRASSAKNAAAQVMRNYANGTQLLVWSAEMYEQGTSPYTFTVDEEIGVF